MCLPVARKLRTNVFGSNGGINKGMGRKRHLLLQSSIFCVFTPRNVPEDWKFDLKRGVSLQSRVPVFVNLFRAAKKGHNCDASSRIKTTQINTQFSGEFILGEGRPMLKLLTSVTLVCISFNLHFLIRHHRKPLTYKLKNSIYRYSTLLNL